MEVENSIICKKCGRYKIRSLKISKTGDGIDKKLENRIEIIASLKNMSVSDAKNEAIRQYVVNQERFILALRRKEYRDLDRQIYSYCPICLGRTSKAYTRRKEKGKTRRVHVGYFCHPCDEFFRKALSIIEVKKEKNPDSMRIEEFMNNFILRSDTTFRIPISVHYYDQLMQISVPNSDGSIEISVPYSGDISLNSVSKFIGSRLDNVHNNNRIHKDNEQKNDSRGKKNVKSRTEVKQSLDTRDVDNIYDGSQYRNEQGGK